MVSFYMPFISPVILYFVSISHWLLPLIFLLYFFYIIYTIFDPLSSRSSLPRYISHCQLPPGRKPAQAVNDHDIMYFYCSATELARFIREGRISCVQLVSKHIFKILAANPSINAVVNYRFSAALDEAFVCDTARIQLVIAFTTMQQQLERDESNQVASLPFQLNHSTALFPPIASIPSVICISRSDTLQTFLQRYLPPFFGVPSVFSESLAMKGFPHTAGLLARRDVVATYTAPVLLNLQRAGVIFLGSSNTSELALWIDSSNVIYGATNNPYMLQATAGGGNGGEAAAIASLCSPIGVGQDICGGLRLPAHFNGVYAHKPTSLYTCNIGMMPSQYGDLPDFLAQVGPIARYPADLWPLVQIMAQSPIQQQSIVDTDHDDNLSSCPSETANADLDESSVAFDDQLTRRRGPIDIDTSNTAQNQEIKPSSSLAATLATQTEQDSLFLASLASDKAAISPIIIPTHHQVVTPPKYCVLHLQHEFLHKAVASSPPPYPSDDRPHIDISASKSTIPLFSRRVVNMCPRMHVESVVLSQLQQEYDTKHNGTTIIDINQPYFHNPHGISAQFRASVLTPQDFSSLFHNHHHHHHHETLASSHIVEPIDQEQDSNLDVDITSSSSAAAAAAATLQRQSSSTRLISSNLIPSASSSSLSLTQTPSSTINPAQETIMQLPIFPASTALYENASFIPYPHHSTCYYNSTYLNKFTNGRQMALLSSYSPAEQASQTAACTALPTTLSSSSSPPPPSSLSLSLQSQLSACEPTLPLPNSAAPAQTQQPSPLAVLERASYMSRLASLTPFDVDVRRVPVLSLTSLARTTLPLSSVEGIVAQRQALAAQYLANIGCPVFEIDLYAVLDGDVANGIRRLAPTVAIHRQFSTDAAIEPHTFQATSATSTKTLSSQHVAPPEPPHRRSIHQHGITVVGATLSHSSPKESSSHHSKQQSKDLSSINSITTATTTKATTTPPTTVIPTASEFSLPVNAVVECFQHLPKAVEYWSCCMSMSSEAFRDALLAPSTARHPSKQQQQQQQQQTPLSSSLPPGHVPFQSESPLESLARIAPQLPIHQRVFYFFMVFCATFCTNAQHFFQSLLLPFPIHTIPDFEATTETSRQEGLAAYESLMAQYSSLATDPHSGPATADSLVDLLAQAKKRLQTYQTVSPEDLTSKPMGFIRRAVFELVLLWFWSYHFIVTSLCTWIWVPYGAVCIAEHCPHDATASSICWRDSTRPVNITPPTGTLIATNDNNSSLNTPSLQQPLPRTPSSTLTASIVSQPQQLTHSQRQHVYTLSQIYNEYHACKLRYPYCNCTSNIQRPSEINILQFPRNVSLGLIWSAFMPKPRFSIPSILSAAVDRAGDFAPRHTVQMCHDALTFAERFNELLAPSAEQPFGAVVLAPPFPKHTPLRSVQLLAKFFNFVYSGIFNVTMSPVTSVPLGLYHNCPTGVQVVGARHADATTIAVALALHQQFGGFQPAKRLHSKY